MLPNAIAVYDKVDYIKVTPESALARLGSETHPKGYQQFEAIAYQRGADGKPHTADDVELGPVDVTWSVEEFYAVYGDDDKEFVGSLSPTGFFTPAMRRSESGTQVQPQQLRRCVGGGHRQEREGQGRQTAGRQVLSGGDRSARTCSGTSRR